MGSVIVNSAATSGRVEAANDTISSVDNNTNRRWSGWDGRNVLPDRIVYTVAPQTEASYLGDSANDKIDYFTV